MDVDDNNDDGDVYVKVKKKTRKIYVVKIVKILIWCYQFY